MSADLFYRDDVVFTSDTYVDLISVVAKQLRSQSTDEWSRMVCESWESNIHGGRGVGMSSLDLDKLANSDEDRQKMVSLLTEVKESVRSAGERIGDRKLGKPLDRDLATFKGLVVAKFVETLDKVIGMLESYDESHGIA